MIFGIGTDIVAVDRFRRFIEENNQKLLDRLFTAAELTRCTVRKDAASCLAARFAAKEAFLKALGTGLRDGLSWHDVEITNNPDGKPDYILSGKARQMFQEHGLKNAHLSLSHDGGNAVAMAVLEGK